MSDTLFSLAYLCFLLQRPFDDVRRAIVELQIAPVTTIDVAPYYAPAALDRLKEHLAQNCESRRSLAMESGTI